ncbi:antibiotic biosynthesis monooxygenase family protein [Mammaliicoccus lentus]|uniref:antibiotic biosynthesis monooxygenase family protein n=1 Tax=Mammaliicoccus lentus TaxID=42858 RepID=UPI0026481616|nr:antibiotic biosynthesis monooxygenase [Mammaliicoccus lentus]
MNFYITTGTYHFLQKIMEKHPNANIHHYTRQDTTVLIHETNGESVFAQPREYSVIESRGEFYDHEFIAASYIPVSEEMRHRFENHYTNIDSEFDRFEGFESFRLLRPKKGDTYMILLGYDSNESYEDFTKSAFFAEYFSREATRKFSGAEQYSTANYTKYWYRPEEDE